MVCHILISACLPLPPIDHTLYTHPQHIIHKRAPPRSDLHQIHPLASLSLCHPFRYHPHPYQFTKNLADLGTGDKVPFDAELVAGGGGVVGGVVAAQVGGEALAHEGCYGDGAGRLASLLVVVIFERLVTRTVIASVSCLAKGVDHLCPSSSVVVVVVVELHLAPEAIHRLTRTLLAFRDSWRIVRGKLLRIAYDRAQYGMTIA